MLLPVAFRIADEIAVLGADGRSQGETYFWSHGKSVQFNDKMCSVRDEHPSFFRDRNYKRYYKNHCRELESLLRHAEQNDKHIVSLTKSLIPALSRRYSPSD